MPEPNTESALLLDVTGAPGRAYAKDVIRVGKWHDPKSGRVVDVTPERIDRWCASFAAMQAAGVNVPVYSGHDRSKPLGHVASLTRDGDALLATHVFADAAAEEQAKRARFSSVCIEGAYKAGNGVDYGEVISHIAATAEPVVPGQRDYVALSRVADAPPVADPKPSNEENIMLDKIKVALGLAADADEATCLSRANELAKRPEPPVELSREVLDIRAENAELHLSALVADGCINAATRDALKVVMLGKADDDKAVCLSRDTAGLAVGKALIEALKLNTKTVKTTGAQTVAQVELSRDGGTGEPAPNKLLAAAEKRYKEAK